MFYLNEFRNKLIAQGRYTDCVDELLVKTVGVLRHQVGPLYGVLPGVPDLLHGPFQRVDLLQKLGLLRLILSTQRL